MTSPAPVRVHLASLVDPSNPMLTRLRQWAARSPSDLYPVTADPAEADLVLFVESGYVGLSDVVRLMRRPVPWRPKAALAMISESDWPLAVLPGLYCSLTRPVPWAASWSYALDEHVDPVGEDGHRYLYSFVGRLSTHPIRQAVRRLHGPGTPCLDISEVEAALGPWERTASFAALLRQSTFVVCPRGLGASSLRIFEALRAGRVPVIVSDDWLAPPTGDWASCSLRVREADVAHIPEICARHGAVAEEMGRRAREMFDACFGPDRYLPAALDTIRGTMAAAGAHGLLARAMRAVSLRELRTVGQQLRGSLRFRR